MFPRLTSTSSLLKELGTWTGGCPSLLPSLRALWGMSGTIRSVTGSGLLGNKWPKYYLSGRWKRRQESPPQPHPTPPSSCPPPAFVMSLLLPWEPCQPELDDFTEGWGGPEPWVSRQSSPTVSQIAKRSGESLGSCVLKARAPPAPPAPPITGTRSGVGSLPLSPWR